MYAAMVKHGHSPWRFKSKDRRLIPKRGVSVTPEYKVWYHMRRRCSPNERRIKDYNDYYARGIRVCERWQSFSNFFADMGPRPTPNHTLERIDVNGNYEPSNCKWATWAEQQLNKRNTVYATINGVTAPLRTFFPDKDSYKRAWARRKRGCSDDQLLAPADLPQSPQRRAPQETTA